MRGWYAFVKAGIGSGYDWLTGTPLSHLGALLLVLGVIGIPYVVSFSYERWVYTPVSLVVVGVVLFSIGAYRKWGEAEKGKADLQAVIDVRQDRLKSITARFEYDGDVFVYIGNSGSSLPDARINLFVPKIEGLTVERITEAGEVATTGHRAEVSGQVMQGIDGAFRWSELHMYLPGANTTWGLQFKVGRVREQITIRFGVNADELGDWIWWEPTIYPLEGDEWEVDAAEVDLDYDEDDDL